MGSSWIFKLGGQSNIQFDYASFLPRPFYLDANSQQLNQHLRAIQQYQTQITKFKYHEDLDRIDNSDPSDEWLSIENYTQQMFVSWLCLSLFLSRLISFQFYKEYYSVRTMFNILPTIMKSLGCVVTFFVVTSQYNRPQNHQYFKTLTAPIRHYINFDRNLNLYKYVDDSKHNVKYPSVKQFNDLRVKLYREKTLNDEKGVIRFFKQKYRNVEE